MRILRGLSHQGGLKLICNVIVCNTFQGHGHSKVKCNQGHGHPHGR